MAYELKPNTGSAFFNKRKERDSQADLTGDLLIEGECEHCGKTAKFNFWLNVWKRLDKNGKIYVTLLANLKKPRADGDSAANQSRSQPKSSGTDDWGDKAEAKGPRGATKDQIDDDIPF